jgi:catechol 2,3-dioxygenase-like lactoylglutathione lyase family enzyme
MLDHIGVNVSDFGSAREFYAAALAPLGYRLAMQPAPNIAGFATADGRAFPFWIAEGRGEITTAHIAFTAPDRATVDAFHKAALDAGGTDNARPAFASSTTRPTTARTS